MTTSRATRESCLICNCGAGISSRNASLPSSDRTTGRDLPSRRLPVCIVMYAIVVGTEPLSAVCPISAERRFRLVGTGARGVAFRVRYDGAPQRIRSFRRLLAQGQPPGPSRSIAAAPPHRSLRSLPPCPQGPMTPAGALRLQDGEVHPTAPYHDPCRAKSEPAPPASAGPTASLRDRLRRPLPEGSPLPGGWVDGRRDGGAAAE
jgi:hypothetical protein